MVQSQIAARGVRDSRVLEAMREVPRHRFVPPQYSAESYQDYPLPIGSGQTISQPYIVACMVETLALKSDERVLEIGTGSGYQTAVLARLASRVFSVERIASLLERARSALASVGVENVTLRLGDGFSGWPEEAPFDAIVLSAAPRDIPRALLEQLKDGGKLVGPIGGFGAQTLVRVTRRGANFDTEALLDVAFVPMLGGVEL